MSYARSPIIRQVREPGGWMYVEKTVTSSAIKTATALAITTPATGKLLVHDIILKTDGSTGLAGGTNFQVLSDNATGLLVIMSTAISGLGAAKTIELAGASVTKIRTVLESGKKLYLQNTAADGTGAGTVTVGIWFRKIDPAAEIRAA